MINILMESINGIASDLFYKVRSRFSGLKLGTETGEITIIPEDARFFDFGYKDEDMEIGHITISLAEPNSMKVYFSTNITEDMDSGQKNQWYRFLKELRGFAKRRLLSFDTRDITKDSLDRRDYKFLTRNAQPEVQPETGIGESVMNESHMYGTRNTSYQKLLDTKLIVKHNQSLKDDFSPGARSRNISALFIENQEGERFKYPFVHLAGARAMQRHVANGGLPYDDLGKSIIGVSEEIAQLKSFSNYVVRNDLMNSENNSIIERSMQALDQLRETISRLAKQKYYEEYKDSFQLRETSDIPEEVIEDYTNKFTVKNFNENIKTVFPIIYRLMKETGTVDYEDIVSMTTTESINDTADVDLSEDNTELEEYENWILSLGEDSPLQTDQAQLQAIDELNKLIDQALPAGANGQNAKLSLKGIIDDEEFYREINTEVEKNKDPEMDVRPLIKKWVEQNASTVLDQLDFGDMDQAQDTDPATDPAAAEEPTTQEPATPAPAAAPAATAQTQQLTLSDDPAERRSNKVNVQDLAEFINSFYDRNTGMFPKGPEGVVVMVGKKFGEQAEQVARKFVERMAPQQGQGAEELEELARIRELSGLQSEEQHTSEDSQSYTITNPDLERDAETGREEPDQIQVKVDHSSYDDEFEIDKVIRLDTKEDITDKVLNNRQLYFDLAYDVQQKLTKDREDSKDYGNMFDDDSAGLDRIRKLSGME